ncbi:hypothetical protein AKJ45_02455 [candidate division MSBL1 archaeon SCGC-AAA261F19]|uniref:FAD-binding FR-type domain-containing protein n=1 Tax=candidate division MSBL1 archaeon SCGC-AAA261F19 TaxID=1698275 RepID=A0A133V9J3_9EURY|nr:hypothetical protein AKJ45_02455 [candidate division MSBL1 archaeon SCGC-AAA261F19]
MESNPYIPYPAEILEISQESPGIKTYTLRFEDDKIQEKFNFNPGMFVQLSIAGVGEVPISISSSPTVDGSFELCIEKKGRVTSALFDMDEGSKVLVRGPYGNGFSLQGSKGKDILFIAGGVGLAPLRSAIDYVHHFRKKYGEVQIFYGDKRPSCLLFQRCRDRWSKYFDMYSICEVAEPGWTGEEGLVTDLMDKVSLDIKNSAAFLCGPPVMYKFVVVELKDIGFADQDIYLSLERRMECGIGKCRRCNVGNKFVCEDGPVFSYDEIGDYTDKET